MDLLNAIITLTNFVIVPAIAYGSQLALGALGVTLIYGILRFSNFAHGDTMAFGTMVTILFTWLFQSWGISLGVFPTALLALPFGIAGCALFVLLTDRAVYRFYREQKAKLGKLSASQVTASELAGQPITQILTEAPGNGAAIGGLKVVTDNGWFAARPSGTEDVYKIYAESFEGDAHLKRIQEEAKALVDGVLNS